MIICRTPVAGGLIESIGWSKLIALANLILKAAGTNTYAFFPLSTFYTFFTFSTIKIANANANAKASLYTINSQL